MVSIKSTFCNFARSFSVYFTIPHNFTTQNETSWVVESKECFEHLDVVIVNILTKYQNVFFNLSVLIERKVET